MPMAGDSAQMYRVINGTDTTAAILERLPVCLDGAAPLKIRWPALFVIQRKRVKRTKQEW